MPGIVGSSSPGPASTKRMSSNVSAPSKSLFGSFFNVFPFPFKKTKVIKEKVPIIIVNTKTENDDDKTQDSASANSDEENDKSQGDKSTDTPPKTCAPNYKDPKDQVGSSSKSLSSNHRDKSSSSPRLNTLTNDTARTTNSVTRDTHATGSSSNRSSARATGGGSSTSRSNHGGSSTSRSNHGSRNEESKDNESGSIRPSRSFNTLGEAHARHASSNKQRQYKPCEGEDEIIAEGLYPSYGSSKRLSPSVYSSAKSDAGSHRSRSRSTSRSRHDDEGGSRRRSDSHSRKHDNHHTSNGGFDGMVGNFQIFPAENRRSHNSTGSSKDSSHGNNREEQGSLSARSSSRSSHHHESSGSLSSSSRSRSRSNSHSLSPRLIPNNAQIRVPSIGNSLHSLAAQAEVQTHPLSPL